MQLEAQWVVGFVDGQGSFHITIKADETNSLGSQILVRFTVVKHECDVKILYALKAYFGCGTVRKTDENTYVYVVTKLDHLVDRICPFFMRHTFKTHTNVHFRKFRTVCLLMHDKKHLTQEGFDKIRAIALSMRRMRAHTTPI